MIIGEEDLDRRELCDCADGLPGRPPPPVLQPGRVSEGGKKIFIWIPRNPLKRPISAKGIQGNPSNFIWFYLDFLGFIWSEFALLVVWP
jgi:hypothetical protein